MRAIKLTIFALLAVTATLMAGAMLLFVLVGWSSSNTKAATAECEMLVIEKRIEPVIRATDYRRACMAAKGYGMLGSCYVDNYSTASCFIPHWMFWINTI